MKKYEKNEIKQTHNYNENVTIIIINDEKKKKIHKRNAKFFVTVFLDVLLIYFY